MQPPPSSIGARPDVPRVEVPADDNDLVGLLASADLANDVRGLRVGQRRAPIDQAQAYRRRVPRDVPARSASSTLTAAAGIRGRVGLVRERAGVRRPQPVEPDGAHERGDARRRRAARDGPGRPIPHRRDVVRERHVEEHDAAQAPRSARASSSSKPDTTTSGASMPSGGVPTLLPRPSIASLALGTATRLLEALRSAHPTRHHDRLGAHVLQRVLLHLAECPLDRVFEGRGAAQPGTEGVGQLGEPPPREGVGEGDAPIRRAAGSRYGASQPSGTCETPARGIPARPRQRPATETSCGCVARAKGTPRGVARSQGPQGPRAKGSRV